MSGLIRYQIMVMVMNIMMMVVMMMMVMRFNIGRLNVRIDKVSNDDVDEVGMIMKMSKAKFSKFRN